MTSGGPDSLLPRSEARPEAARAVELPAADPPTVGAANRYEVVRLPPDDQGREGWAVVDWLTGRWVQAGGEVDVYAAEFGARACIRRLRYLDELGARHD
ncbi:hypothetical protein OHV05_01970 [Kitasatospora sp. NBC_00070]|uniref:hypothetical protein n=1 Tax=Kitasatospora sp. NBC_00070 TaxID=2975962 RepID=UPI0032458CFF